MKGQGRTVKARAVAAPDFFTLIGTPVTPSLHHTSHDPRTRDSQGNFGGQKKPHSLCP